MDTITFWDQLPQPARETLLRVLLAVLALLVIWLLRRILTWLFVAPLRRYTRKNSIQWGESLLEAVIPPVRALVFALGLYVVASILELDPETRVFADHLIRTLVIIAIFLVIYRVMDVLTESSPRLYRVSRIDVEDRLLPFVRTGVKVVILAVLLVIVIGEWGYNVSGLIAGLGLGGLAVSLAAQDTIANLFGFSAIVGDRPFVVGEYIKTPDVEGTVEHVGLRSTRVRQPDQAYVTIPNSKLVSSAVLNWSRLSKRWLNTTMRIEYTATSRQLEALLERLRAMLAARERVEPDSIVVFFTNFGEQALEVLVRCYIPIADWVEFSREKEAINLEILRIVEDLGLSLAVPNRPMWVGRLPEPSNHEESVQS